MTRPEESTRPYAASVAHARSAEERSVKVMGERADSERRVCAVHPRRAAPALTRWLHESDLQPAARTLALGWLARTEQCLVGRSDEGEQTFRLYLALSAGSLNPREWTLLGDLGFSAPLPRAARFLLRVTSRRELPPRLYVFADRDTFISAETSRWLEAHLGDAQLRWALTHPRVGVSFEPGGARSLQLSMASSHGAHPAAPLRLMDHLWSRACDHAPWLAPRRSRWTWLTVPRHGPLPPGHFTVYAQS